MNGYDDRGSGDKSGNGRQLNGIPLMCVNELNPMAVDDTDQLNDGVIG
ncbi:MAG: hypothetical protein NTY32_05435 [Bacteroidia bacterium]|nr:hypothetical protein [Bacteroidia bacterium]